MNTKTQRSGDAAESMNDGKSASPESANSEMQDPGIIREFIEFLRYNKKWWLAPILVAMLLLIGFVFLAASPAAPFIYTLF